MSLKPRKVLGTPNANGAKLMFLGAGELGKETMIEAQRMEIEIVAVDRYANSPGMQVAHRSYVINMKSERALMAVVERERPDAIIPEIEAINIDTLFKLEEKGFFVAPNAKAVWTAMHRERLEGSDRVDRRQDIEVCLCHRPGELQGGVQEDRVPLRVQAHTVLQRQGIVFPA